MNAKQALDASGLWHACSDSHIEIVKLLLDKGAEVNAWQALNGLELACSNGHTSEIVKLLLDKGADLNAPNFQ